MKFIIIIIFILSSCYPLEKTTRSKHYRQNSPKISETSQEKPKKKNTRSKSSNKTETKQIQKLSIRSLSSNQKPIDLFLNKWIGVPYQYGGTNEKGIDCSALTGAFYHEIFEIELSRTAAQQYSQGRFVKKNYLRKGDLVFFDLDNDKFTIDHVGVFLDDGKFVHASTTKGVTVSELDDSYYSDNYIGARRIN